MPVPCSNNLGILQLNLLPNHLQGRPLWAGSDPELQLQLGQLLLHLPDAVVVQGYATATGSEVRKHYSQ